MIPNLCENNNNMKNLRKYLEERNYEKLKKFLETSTPSSINAALNKASKKELEIIVNIFPNLAHVSMLGMFDTNLQNAVISVIYDDNLKKVLDSSSNDELFLMTSFLDRDSKKKILNILPINRCGMLHIKYKHISDNVGNLCSMDYVLVPLYWTVSQTLNLLSKHESLKKDPVILIVNEKIEVIGYVPLTKLLINDINAKISNIMLDIKVRVNVNESAKNISNYLEKPDVTFALVEDDFSKPIGVITTKELLHSVNNNYEDSDNISIIEKCAKLFPAHITFGILGLISFFVMPYFSSSLKSTGVILMTLLTPLANTLLFISQDKSRNCCMSSMELFYLSIENFICSFIVSFLVSASCISKIGLTSCVSIFITMLICGIILLLINALSVLLLNFSTAISKNVLNYYHVSFSIFVQILITIPVLNLIHDIIFSKVLI